MEIDLVSNWLKGLDKTPAPSTTRWVRDIMNRVAKRKKLRNLYNISNIQKWNNLEDAFLGASNLKIITSKTRWKKGMILKWIDRLRSKRQDGGTSLKVRLTKSSERIITNASPIGSLISRSSTSANQTISWSKALISRTSSRTLSNLYPLIIESSLILLRTWSWKRQRSKMERLRSTWVISSHKFCRWWSRISLICIQTIPSTSSAWYSGKSSAKPTRSM